MERPLLLPLTALIAGLCTTWFLPGSIPFILPTFLFLFACAVVGLFLRNPIPFVCAVAALIFLWGYLSLQPHLQTDSAGNQLKTYDGSSLVVEGVVASRPEHREEGGRLTVQVERLFSPGRLIPAAGRLLVSIGDGDPPCTTGDRIRFEARLRSPRPYGLPGEFDYRRYLSLRGIDMTAYVEEGRDILLLEAAALPSLQRRIDILAGRIGKGIDAALPQPEAGILRALLIGDMGRVPQSIKDAYSRTGVNHILSISGFHIGIVALLLFHLLFAACRLLPFLLLHGWLRRGLGAAILPVLVFYLLLSGSAPATVRSVVMLTACSLALMLERETDSLNTLLLAALVILGVEPAALFDISFQFSFLALWGIIVLTPILMGLLPDLGRGIRFRFLQFLAASTAATIATLVPVAYYFHQASATGLISNFAIVPLMGYGAVITGFVALPLLLISPVLALPFLHAAGFMIHVSNWLIEYLDRLPLLPRFIPDRLQLGLFFLAMVSITFLKRPTWRWVTTGGLLAGICAVSLVPGMRPANTFSAVFLSVGQGESTLLTFPDGKTMLIDGGGTLHASRFDVGERLVAPALWSLGVRRIDYLVLTHVHPDHLNGLPYIARTFSIGEFWEGDVVESGERYEELKRILVERGVRSVKLNSSTHPITVGGVGVAVLNPISGGSGLADINDQSLVLRFSNGSFSMLMSGDAGIPIQQRLLSRPELIRCTVLKVPHHGSRLTNLPEFYRTAAPEVALVSAGYGNRFHFPAVETVTELHRLGAALYRTDLHGTVMIVQGGEGAGYRIYTPFGHFN